MSTFSDWNGPQQSCGNGPSTKSLIDYTNAYNELKAEVEELKTQLGMLSELTTTVKSSAVAAINEVDTNVDLAQESADAANTGVNGLLANIGSVAELGTTAKTVVPAINEVNTRAGNTQTNLENYIDSVATDIAKIDTLDESVTSLDSTVTSVQRAIATKQNTITNTTDLEMADLTADEVTAREVTAKLNIDKEAEFTNWQTVNAVYAGTGSIDTTDTNGLYAIGSVAKYGTTSDFNNFKPGRAYVRYVDGANRVINAVIDIVVADTDTSPSGALTVTASISGEFSNLKFHLARGLSATDGSEQYWLCISADDLSNSEVSSGLTMQVAGINFVPLSGILPANVNSEVCSPVLVHGSGVAVSDISLQTLPNTDSIKDLEDIPIVTKTVDTTTETEGVRTIRTLTFGRAPDEDEGVLGDDRMIFTVRPGMYLADESTPDEPHYSGFVTALDIQDLILPVGSVIRWGAYTTEDNVDTLINIPEHFMECNGAQLAAASYPDLAAVFNVPSTGTITLPTETHSIIKVETVNLIEATAASDGTFVYTLEGVNARITAETLRAEAAEATISETATEALETATAASETATAASETATAASETATTASETATEALEAATAASEAIGDLSELTTDDTSSLVAAINEVDANADTAETTAEAAQTTANTAVSDAAEAQSTADAAAEAASDAQTTADAAATAEALAQTNSNVSSLDERVTALENE